jgi:hypothetical protein
LREFEKREATKVDFKITEMEIQDLLAKKKWVKLTNNFFNKELVVQSSVPSINQTPSFGNQNTSKLRLMFE